MAHDSLTNFRQSAQNSSCDVEFGPAMPLRKTTLTSKSYSNYLIAPKTMSYDHPPVVLPLLRLRQKISDYLNR